jgi:hypothetical protein
LKKKAVMGAALVIVISMIVISAIFLLNNNNNTNQNDKNQMLNAKNVKDQLNYPYLKQYLNFVEYKQDIEARFGRPYLSRKVGKNVYEIRRIDDGSKLYVIYYPNDGQYHDGEARYIWRIKKLFKKENFQNLKPGLSTYEDVISIDEYSYYWRYEYFAGEDEGEGITEHRLADNESLVIHYIEKGNVKVIKELQFLSPDPSNFSNILLKKDLREIMP